MLPIFIVVLIFARVYVLNKSYEHLFDVPYSAKIDNDASGLSPVSTLRPPGDNVLFAGDSLFSTVKS